MKDKNKSSISVDSNGTTTVPGSLSLHATTGQYTISGTAQGNGNYYIQSGTSVAPGSLRFGSYTHYNNDMIGDYDITPKALMQKVSDLESSIKTVENSLNHIKDELRRTNDLITDTKIKKRTIFKEEE